MSTETPEPKSPVGEVRDFPRWPDSYDTYSEHAAVRWTDDPDEPYPWLLLGSEGPQKLSNDSVEGCRVIGACPGTPAAATGWLGRWLGRMFGKDHTA